MGKFILRRLLLLIPILLGLTVLVFFFIRALPGRPGQRDPRRARDAREPSSGCAPRSGSTGR